jgi:LPS-assembly lipoprotein
MRRRALAAFAPSLLLAGCGFRLRQAPTFAFKTIYINAPATSPIGQDLKKTLASGGTVKVLASPAEADVVLDVLAETRQKVVVGLSAVGQVTEFELRMRFRFRLRTREGRELIPDTEVTQSRDVSFTESAALSKEPEEQLLYRDMQADIVQQTMRRMAAATLA